MPKEKTKSKPENAPQEKAGGDCVSCIVLPLVDFLIAETSEDAAAILSESLETLNKFWQS